MEKLPLSILLLQKGTHKHGKLPSAIERLLNWQPLRNDISNPRTEVTLAVSVMAEETEGEGKVGADLGGACGHQGSQVVAGAGSSEHTQVQVQPGVLALSLRGAGRGIHTTTPHTSQPISTTSLKYNSRARDYSLNFLQNTVLSLPPACENFYQFWLHITSYHWHQHHHTDTIKNTITTKINTTTTTQSPPPHHHHHHHEYHTSLLSRSRGLDQGWKKESEKNKQRDSISN